jgi:hypothetical protein
MRATLIHREKHVFADGAIVEMVIWRTPEPVPGSRHGYKYRLYFGRAGVRIVGFDNEGGKGDHRHIDGVEQPYRFSGVEALIEDFLNAVRERSGP